MMNNHYRTGKHEVDTISTMLLDGRDYSTIEGAYIYNIIKYIGRCNEKGSREQDLIKAIEYLMMMLRMKSKNRDKVKQLIKECLDNDK